MKSYEERKGRLILSLWEGMMLLGIVFMLSAILAPVFRHANQRSPLTVCAANMKELGAAMSRYVEDWDGMYPPNRFPRNPTNALPSGGHEGSPYNWKRALIASGQLRSRDVWFCPANPGHWDKSHVNNCLGDESNCRGENNNAKSRQLPISYVYNGAFFHEVYGVRHVSEIKDQSSLIMFIEARSGGYPEIGDWACSWVFQHKNVSNWAFADGQVRTLSLTQTLRPRYMWRNPDDATRHCISTGGRG